MPPLPRRSGRLPAEPDPGTPTGPETFRRSTERHRHRRIDQVIPGHIDRQRSVAEAPGAGTVTPEEMPHPRSGVRTQPLQSALPGGEVTNLPGQHPEDRRSPTDRHDDRACRTG